MKTETRPGFRYDIVHARRGISGHVICVNDITESDWDWQRGEPPEDNPDYYLRTCKSFSRMGGEMNYVCLDNRAFLGRLLAGLNREK